MVLRLGDAMCGHGPDIGTARPFVEPPRPATHSACNPEGHAHALRRRNVLHRSFHATGELGPLLEQRGFESLWVPEHSHIPVVRTTPFPGGRDCRAPYYDIMDPFLVLTAAAVATKTLKVGTGVCLINQRDPIQTAKLVASIDQLSDGRFLFGVGNGWNNEEMENHGTAFETRHKLSRERIEAMKAIWTQDTAEYHGEFVNFAPMQTWPKPVQKPLRRSSSAAHSRTARAVRCVMATAGSPAPPAQDMPT